MTTTKILFFISICVVSSYLFCVVRSSVCLFSLFFPSFVSFVLLFLLFFLSILHSVLCLVFILAAFGFTQNLQLTCVLDICSSASNLCIGIHTEKNIYTKKNPNRFFVWTFSLYLLLWFPVKRYAFTIINSRWIYFCAKWIFVATVCFYFFTFIQN